MAHAFAYAQSNDPARGLSAPRLVIVMDPAARHNVLLHRVAEARDRQAFQELFAHFAPRVKAYLMRFVANGQIAEDLAQETMLTLWRKAALFDPAKASASTWVFTIARNLRIDTLRREQRPLFDAADPSLAPPPGNDPDQGVEAHQTEAAIRSALDALPTDQAAVVRMSFFSDKPHPEIAAELGIPLGTVKSRLRLAMDRLRAALKDQR